MNFHPEYKDKTKRGKKKKQKTECSVLQRQYGCGICGSENIAIQGVKYCKICGAEIEFLKSDNGYNFFRKTDVKVPCNCVKTTIIKNKEHKYRQINSIGVKKCLDCGAICSSFCPNCKQQSLGYSYYGNGCWKLGDKYFCKKCGYKI